MPERDPIKVDNGLETNKKIFASLCCREGEVESQEAAKKVLITSLEGKEIVGEILTKR